MGAAVPCAPSSAAVAVLAPQPQTSPSMAAPIADRRSNYMEAQNVVKKAASA